MTRMKKIISSIAFCAVLVCASAHALDTYRFGSRLIEVGDPVTKLVDLAGEPVYKEPVQDAYGAYEGERWQYKIEGHYVTFVIRNAKVTSIQEAYQ